MLPFTGLNSPNGVAVDTKGNVYVADHQNHRVLKLSAGSNTPIVLPFPTGPDGLRLPTAVAVDNDGNLYVSDCMYPGRVWKLAAGSTSPIVLLETDKETVEGLAVDSAGNLYGSQAYGWIFSEARVWKMAAPTAPNAPQTVLPFTDLKGPLGVAVDRANNVYVVADFFVTNPAMGSQNVPISEHRVLKLSADSTTQTVLPFTGVTYPYGVAVDSGGNVYVTDGDTPLNHDPAQTGGRVVKLPNGSGAQTVLPFTGLSRPLYVAVRPPWMPAPADSVYVSDVLANRVLQLGLGNAS